MQSIKIKIVDGEKAKPYINKIGKLLYDTYILECGWKFAEDNLSNISIETDALGNKIILDEFMKVNDEVKKTIWSVR